VREGWEVKKLDEFCDIEYGTRVVRKRDGGTIFPVYGGGGATFFMDTSNRENCLVIARFAMSEKCTRFVKGKFFLNDSGLTVQPKNKNEILQEFLNLQFFYLNDYIYSLARGTAQKNLDVPKFRKIEIVIPPLPEQTKIVKTLDLAFKQIDQAKANLEKNLANAKELFASKLNEVFSQRGEGWEEKRLGEITTKIGSGSTPRGGQASYKESGISLIRSMNVHDDGFREKKLAFIDEEQALKLKNVTIEEDDVLLNITGASVARCCIVPKEYLPARVNQHVSIIRLKENILHSSYLHYCLTAQENKNKLLNIGRQGATREAITKVQIENFMISYPQDMDIQLKILEELDGIKIKSELLQTHYQQKLNNLEELKKSILQKAFRGA